MLPDYTPATEIVRAPWAGDGTFSYGSFRHPVVKAPDGRLAVDVWHDPDKGIMARVWCRKDHPNLGKLPWNAPRKVKALYRAEGQLAYLRGTGDYWTDPAKLALDAWEQFTQEAGTWAR